MEREEDIHDELENISPGFPKKKSMDPPQDYFETFPDKVLNRWRTEESHPKSKMINWKWMVGIAAGIIGLFVGGWLVLNNNQGRINEITSIEAYQYIHENIDEFEPLLETGDIQVSENHLDVPKEAVDEYIIEEIHESNPEDLF